MNTFHTHNLDDHDIDTALRTLDVADRELAPAQRARKDALLESLLAQPMDQPPGEQTLAEVVPMQGRPRRRARWLIPAAAAAAVVAGGIGIWGPSTTKAYASWTATPTPVSGETLATAENACKAGMRDLGSQQTDLPPELRSTANPDTARTVVAERRGNYLFLAMVTDDGSTSQCFFDADKPTELRGVTASGMTASSPALTPLAADKIEASGNGSSSGPEGSYAFAIGRVGADVKAVTVHADGKTTQATVSNGNFAAWWPAENPRQGATYDVTLKNGTVQQNVDTGLPALPPAPGPREIGRIGIGGGVGDGGQEVATVEGEVGSEVVGVTVILPDREVKATVERGTFRAEWPSAVEKATPEPSYRLTLRDGTVVDHVKPAPATAVPGGTNS